MDSLPAAARTVSLASPTKDDHILPSSSLLHGVPKDVDDLRTKIFNVQEPIILLQQEYDTYWPYFNNIFLLNQTKHHPDRETNQYWRYRLYESKTH
jgi:hypothetical protein